MLSKWKKLRAKADIYLSEAARNELDHRLGLWRELKSSRSEAGVKTRRELEEWLTVHMDWWDKLWGDENRSLAHLDLKAMGIDPNASVTRQKKALHDYFTHRAFPPEPELKLFTAKADFDISQADLVCANTFSFLNNKPHCIGPHMDWNANPFGDIEWPTGLQRHYAWPVLCNGYRMSGDEKYAHALVRFLVDWASRNPIRTWSHQYFPWSTLNAAIRCKTWARIVPVFIQSSAFTPEMLLLYLSALRQNMNFLMKNRAERGNWLLFESEGLVRVGCRFHEFKEAKAWRKEGSKRLCTEMSTQILPDGSHEEFCPTYHIGVLGSFHYPVSTAYAYGFADLFDGKYLSRLKRAYRFFASLSKPDGRLPAIGDTGNPGKKNHVMPVLAHGAKDLGMDDVLFIATRGKGGKTPPNRHQLFKQSGHCVMRDSWQKTKRFLLFDVAPHGGWHSHFDSLQVIVWGFGHDLLADTGCYGYSEPAHSFYAETKHHNTVTVNNGSQDYSKSKITGWKSTDDFCCAAGLGTQYKGTTHLREVIFVENSFWVVLDTIDGNPGDTYQQWWHLGQDKGRLGQNGVCRTRNLLLVTAPLAGVSRRLTEGEIVAYNIKKKRPVLKLEKTTTGLAHFVTLIYPHKTGAKPAAHFSKLKLPARAGGSVNLTLTTPEGEYELDFNGKWPSARRQRVRRTAD